MMQSLRILVATAVVLTLAGCSGDSGKDSNSAAAVGSEQAAPARSPQFPREMREAFLTNMRNEGASPEAAECYVSALEARMPWAQFESMQGDATLYRAALAESLNTMIHAGGPAFEAELEAECASHGGMDGPRSGDALHRQMVGDAVQMVGAARTPVMEHYAMSAAWPTEREFADLVRVRSSQHASNLRVRPTSNGGEILVDVNQPVGGTVIQAYDEATGTWTCRGERIQASLLPSSCR